MRSRLALAAALAPLAASAAPTAECPRALPEAAALLFLDALAAGKAPAGVAASGFTYMENDATLDLGKGLLLSSPVAVSLNRTYVDVEQCAAFIEINAAGNKKPMVIISRVFASGDAAAPVITGIDSVVTKDGDWAFNAAGHLAADKQEKWDAIPEAKRDTRAVLKAAADAYLDSWGDGTVAPPFGNPCSRIEGGSSTARGSGGGNTCKMPQFPGNFKITKRRYAIDPDFGAVDIFNGFPFIDKAKPDGTPSTNLYRIEGGKIRYIHELTVCTNKGCGR